MKLSFNRLVQSEANDAVKWYDEQREGLGDDFFLKLKEALNLIASHPENFGFWLGSKTVRRVKLKRYPHAVLYDIRPGKV